MIKPPDAIAYRRDDLGVRMAEHRAHLARGEVQHPAPSGIVEKRTFGPNRYKVDELAAIFEQVTPSSRLKFRIARTVLFHHFISASWAA